MGFSRQEYWSGLLFPSPGDHPDSEIKHASPSSPALAGGFFTIEPPGKPTESPTPCLHHILGPIADVIVVSPPGSPKPLLAEGLGLADILKLSLSGKNLV